MPTTLPRRRISTQGRSVKLALAVAILVEGLTLATAVAHEMAKAAAPAPTMLHEQIIAQALAAMLSP